MSWRLASLKDVVEISSQLREEDIEEVQAMYGVDPTMYLPLHYDKDRTWVFGDQGVDFGLAGIEASSMPDTGMIWMLSTPELYNHKTVFLRKSREFIEEMHGYYPILFNYVDARQTDHLKWLKWCGFKAVDQKLSWGVAGIPFYEMVKLQNGGM